MYNDMTTTPFHLRGSVVPLITPLTTDEEIDIKAFDGLLQFQRELGTDAIFLMGSCGEGPCLTDDARQTVLDSVLALEQTLPIFVGVSEPATRRAVQWAVQAARKEVTALVVMLPTFHWNKSADEMVDHFRAIYDSTGKPIILYNFPLKTDGVAIPVEVIRHLRQENIIIGIKDSSGDLDYLSQLVALRDELGGLGVMNGELKKAYEALKLGVDGLVMSYTNVEPDKCREMIQAVQKKDFERAQAIQQRMVQAWNTFDATVNPVMKVKAILAARGLCEPICCAPVRPIEPVIPEPLKGEKS